MKLPTRIVATTATFGAADNHLTISGDDVYYHGSKHTVFFSRSAGEYFFTAPDSGTEEAQQYATYGPRPTVNSNLCWA